MDFDDKERKKDHKSFTRKDFLRFYPRRLILKYIYIYIYIALKTLLQV